MDYDFSKYTEVDFNGTPISEVYLDGSLVWFKAKLLGFTFSGSNVTGYTGTETSITIPDSYSTITDSSGNTYYVEGNDIAVTGIGAQAFSNSNLSSVTLHSGLTSIGEKAFYNCSLISITLPNTIKTMGKSAFEQCSKLSSITLSSGLASLEESVFSGCTSLKTITIPASIKDLKKNCFYNCSSLATVNMSATPTSIGERAFSNTAINNLSSYMYNCTSLGKGCFASNVSWAAIGIGYSAMERVRATTTSPTSLEASYVFISFIQGNFNHVSGDDTPGAACSIEATISCGLRDFGLSASFARGSTGHSGYILYNSTLSTPTFIDKNLSVSSESNISSYSWEKSVGYVTSDGMYCYRKKYDLNITSTCIVEGTNITLADGTHKRVEQLKYNDLLRVWNLETGQFDYQYPLAIVKGEQHNAKYRITIEDGSHLEICGRHDIFDPVAHQFRTYGEGAINSLDGDYYVMKDNGSNIYSSMKIISIDIINETVTSYGIITSGIITAFANDMMIGLGVLNLVPITEENKFSEIFENLKKTCYTYDKLVTEIYSDVEKDLAIGLNLLMTDIYHKDASGLPNLISPFRKRKPLPTCNGKKIHNLTFDDGKLTTIKSLEDETIILPEIKTLGKNKWYIVGEYKYLEPGDTYITKFSTVIKAV